MAVFLLVVVHFADIDNDSESMNLRLRMVLYEVFLQKRYFSGKRIMSVVILYYVSRFASVTSQHCISGDNCKTMVVLLLVTIQMLRN